MAVDKKVIFFDDSILERIRFIREQRAAGQTLDQTKEMISAELAEEAKARPTWESLQAAHEDFMGEIREFTRKWEKGERRDEVLASLKLDSLMSGQPITFVIPAIGKPAGSLDEYLTAFSIIRIKKLKSWGAVAGAVAHNARTRETLNADPAVPCRFLIGSPDGRPCRGL